MALPPEKLLNFALKSRSRSELLIAARDGRIVFAKPRTRRWLQGFFPEARANSRLPRPVCRWLARVPAESERDCFIATEGGAELVVRPTTAKAAHLRCLVLRVRPVRPPTTLPRARRLTPRQAEVLRWLAQGKTNAEIAEIIERKPDTVAKHLQCVFDKLGVDNRSSAVAYAWAQSAPGRTR